MSETLSYIFIFLTGTIISSLAQILLKKQADIKGKTFLQEYLNFKTISAYILFFSSTLCTLIAFKALPLSMGPILGTTEYLFVTTLSYFVLHEKISNKKKIGLILIVLGIIVFSCK